MSEPIRSQADSQDTLIEAQGVQVAYRSYKDRPTSLKESVLRLLREGRAARYSTFLALDNVSFSVERGTVVGIMGSNGSGKSTLLKILARVMRPTAGSVAVRGSVASLIELGVGFDPEMNAIENIYLHGSLHRRRRVEIAKRVDAILEFAELQEFATTPIKYYSSGMAARLGFSVAIDIDPDILLIDEILSVGDERFQEKCRGVFRSFIERKKTICIVSHDAAMIESFAKRVLLLSRGKLVYDGDPHRALELYRDRSYETALGHG